MFSHCPVVAQVVNRVVVSRVNSFSNPITLHRLCNYRNSNIPPLCSSCLKTPTVIPFPCQLSPAPVIIKPSLYFFDPLPFAVPSLFQRETYLNFYNSM